MGNFTFEASDCIAMRRAVQKFYLGIADGRNNVLPNIVDAAKPWEDVVADFQMLMYMYLLMEGNREVERAAEVEQNGVHMIRKQAKMMLQQYRNDYRAIKSYMPMNNVEFLGQYADVDEAISKDVEQIVQQTYYPILNNMLKNSNDVASPVAQTIAHLITAMSLAIMACEKGIRDNHHVPSRLLNNIGDRICRLAAAVNQINKSDVVLDMELLEQSLDLCSNVINNVLTETLHDIAEHATEIDLEPYVAAADYTKERFMHLINSKEYDYKAEARRLRRAGL